MIRDYLPYESAREYMDRGMMKWTGFFLSEHNSSLEEKDLKRSRPEKMPFEKLALLLRQAYLFDLRITIYTEKNEDYSSGKVVEIFGEKISFREEEKVTEISMEEIRDIKLIEEL